MTPISESPGGSQGSQPISNTDTSYESSVQSPFALEVLDCTLMFFRRCSSVECAKIFALACFCIYLARVETVLT